MPTYDYRCTHCSEQIEIFHSIKDAPKKKCPKCGHNTLLRLISMPGGIIFKGPDFYRSVDYINQKAREDGMVHTEERRDKGTI